MFGERYIPEEALQPPKEEQAKGIMTTLARRAEGKLAMLGIAAGIFFGSMRTAHAEEAPPKPTVAEKAEAEELKIDTQIEKEVAGLGRVRYVSGAQGEREIISDVRGEETVTALRIHNEGNPKIKGDEQDTEALFVRTDYELAGKKKRELHERFKFSGTISPRENPFGYIDGFPASLRKSGDDSLNRLRANGDLQDSWQALTVVRGFRAVDKGNTVEALHVQEGLKKQIREFQKAHPDIPIPAQALQEAFGQLK